MFRAAVVHGGSAVKEIIRLEAELNLDVVEIMMCPHGCQNGGGQPRQIKKDMIPKRAEGLDYHDRRSAYNSCESNVELQEFKKQYMPDEHAIHECFHTHFVDRSKL